EILSDRPYVRLMTPSGEPLVELFVPFGVDTLVALDDTTSLSELKETATAEGATFELEATSSVWKRKTYRIHCSKAQIRFETHVEGEGDLTDVRYFGGNYSGQPRWGTGFVWSGTSLRRGVSPEPTAHQERYFAPHAGAPAEAAASTPSPRSTRSAPSHRTQVLRSPPPASRYRARPAGSSRPRPTAWPSKDRRAGLASVSRRSPARTATQTCATWPSAAPSI